METTPINEQLLHCSPPFCLEFEGFPARRRLVAGVPTNILFNSRFITPAGDDRACRLWTL